MPKKNTKQRLPRKFISKNGYEAFIDINGYEWEFKELYQEVPNFNEFRKLIIGMVPKIHY